MEIIPDSKRATTDPLISGLVGYLLENENELGLEDSNLYYDFPLYRDDDSIVISKLLLVSKSYGVIIIGIPSSNETKSIEIEASNIEKVYSFLYTRLFRNKNLKKSMTELNFPVQVIVFAQDIAAKAFNESGVNMVQSYNGLDEFLAKSKIETITDSLFSEINSTLSGAKGIIRVKQRILSETNPKSKGNIVSRLEAEIASFDQKQRYGQIPSLDGFERVRGLAGSGKTIILAMKAALIHLRYPEANIVYTFYTRSLYQHIRRLITRFYKQFDEREPDWTKIQVLHGWGGQTADGVYYSACKYHNVTPVPFREAQRMKPTNPFDFVCESFLKEVPKIQPMYDYIFIDEGQDFPISFVKMCLNLAVESKVLYAYDDLQTIFQLEAPAPSQVGTKLSEDILLYKCYRNPREVILLGHALGFGIYSSRIVQMPENKDYWEDIGYKVIEGEFIKGSQTIIERPLENSLPTISENFKSSEIVQVEIYGDYHAEIFDVAKKIQSDIADGLRPDDILVAVVDDLNAKTYLTDISNELTSLGIPAHNIHSDQYGIVDFQREGCVTLSTVHKAKGNEAYMVYVVGVDSLFSPYAGGRERNILYTAITRAKGWVRISGIGAAANVCKKEVEKAMSLFPNLVFSYPSPEELRIMKRDLAEKDARKQKAERMLDQILDTMTPEEIQRFIEQKGIKKVKAKGKGKGR